MVESYNMTLKNKKGSLIVKWLKLSFVRQAKFYRILVTRINTYLIHEGKDDVENNLGQDSMEDHVFVWVN
jgi:hypothetical protein